MLNADYAQITAIRLVYTPPVSTRTHTGVIYLLRTLFSLL